MLYAHSLLPHFQTSLLFFTGVKAAYVELLTEVLMRITKIEIDKYKSIKEPVEISFFDDLPTILIGKNGSGKTNILEALNTIAEANSRQWGLSREVSLTYKVHIHLSEEDAAQLFPDKSVELSECRFVAYSGKNGKINKIESAYLVPLLKAEVSEITKLVDKLNTALDTYTKQLHAVAHSDYTETSLTYFQITDFRNTTTNYCKLKSNISFILDSAKALAASLMLKFSDEEHTFQFNNVNNFFRWGDWEKLSFKLRYEKPELTPFEEKLIIIDEKALKRKIAKINKATKESCDKITRLLEELGVCAKRMEDALAGERPTQNDDNVFYAFIREVQACIGGIQCLFLRNENSTVLFKTDEREREYSRSNISRVIWQTYLNKVYTGADKDELQKQIDENKDLSLPDEALDEFEQYLNNHLPDFENGMYDRISVERSGGNILTILLHENSGETVALPSTSAGRRWYFTYYFMKNMLAPGNWFIIDEPASMLHPIAQKEVRQELLDLSRQGIHVVYATHSPYLIPSERKSVHFVSMTDSGTTITQENTYKLLKQITGGDIFDLQELLEKYQKCGAVGAAHNCYKALIGKYRSIEDAAKNVPFSCDTIESWKKKKRGTSLENVISIANKIDVSPEKLL